MYEGLPPPDADLLVAEPVTGVPEELEVLEPGASLAVMLEAVTDLSALSDSELVAVLAAQGRQIAHLQALQMSVMTAVADRCVPRVNELSEGRGESPIDYAATEIAAGMSWTYNAADRQLGFAEQLIRDLPEVHAALLVGHIDWPKASVFARALQTVDPTVARTVVAKVLPGADQRTTEQLRARLHKLVMKADPGAAKRRYRDGIKRRSFQLWREDDGTASLSARNLPADRAAAVNARIQAIADAAKEQGDQHCIDQLRANTVLDLLQGLAVPGFDGQDARPIPGDPHHNNASTKSGGGRNAKRKGRRGRKGGRGRTGGRRADHAAPVVNVARPN